MTGLGDRLTTVLTREFIRGWKVDDRPSILAPGLKIVAATTVSSLVAALAARRLGAAGLAIATGFGTLDADPRPTLSLLESGLGSNASPIGPPSDTFAAVSKGWVGVVVVPAQLDARCRTNLSRIWGTEDRPGVALPGSRGLPDNNHSPSRVWYLLPDHSPRQLVAEVDFVSGAEPTAGQDRRLVTKHGIFAYEAGSGWSVTGVFEGTRPGDLAVPGFRIGDVELAETIAEPVDEELAALDKVDPEGLRHLEFMGRDAVAHSSEIIAKERVDWSRP